SADFQRKTPAKGWMLVGRFWNKELIGNLEQNSGLRLVMSDQDDFPHVGDFDSARISFVVPLNGYDGREVSHVHAIKYIPIIAKFVQTNRNTTSIVGTLSLLIFCMLMVIFYMLVIRPVGQITKSIEKKDPALIHHLAGKEDEMGQ